MVVSYLVGELEKESKGEKEAVITVNIMGEFGSLDYLKILFIQLFVFFVIHLCLVKSYHTMQLRQNVQLIDKRAFNN